MKKLYKEETFNLSTSFYDQYDRLRPHGILDLFQEIAGRHAEELNIGFHPLFEQGMIWLLARNKYHVVNQPVSSGEVVVKTWPLPAQRFSFFREYEIKSKDGVSLIIGESLWVLFDYQNNRLLPCNKIEIHGEYLPRNFHDEFSKIETFPLSSCLYVGQFVVKPSVIDHNGHMNNAKYADLFLDVAQLQKEEIICDFQADYLQQNYVNDVLDIYLKRSGLQIYVYGYKNEKLSFQLYGKLKD